jgi:hypothetical protein
MIRTAFRFNENKRVWLEAFSKPGADFGTLICHGQKTDANRDSRKIGIFFSILLDAFSDTNMTPLQYLQLPHFWNPTFEANSN